MARRGKEAEDSEQREEGAIALERIIFFSDAVFAIAITLLVLEIRLPELTHSEAAEKLPEAVLNLWPKFLSYFISFLLVGVYWVIHHRVFRYIRSYDSTFMWLNLFILMFVAFLPFPTSMLGSYGDQPFPVAFYAACLAATGFASFMLWQYASRGYRLIDPDMDPRQVRLFTLRSLTSPVVFTLSIPLVFISPILAQLFWLVAPMGRGILNRIFGYRA